MNSTEDIKEIEVEQNYYNTYKNLKSFKSFSSNIRQKEKEEEISWEIHCLSLLLDFKVYTLYFQSSVNI